ncbi:hypothetical protein MKW98_010601 [Papaver atlanticum]|uniref:Uncharacterized protein n=1 Tax=Papaver atlanticum TaxID=357466 RepID=A0AAD4S3N3_9MAGN|nr:hypothetical protein MKW98_010601 [Papaver atlanticum]
MVHDFFWSPDNGYIDLAVTQVLLRQVTHPLSDRNNLTNSESKMITALDAPSQGNYSDKTYLMFQSGHFPEVATARTKVQM